MSDYGVGYFEARQRDEALREAMRVQEVERVRQRTGLDGGTVVDVGCGLGELLAHYPADRWRRFGIEPAASARAACEAKGISFDLPEGPGWCDLVLLRGSLQHLDRPVQALADARCWLRPGGWLVAHPLCDHVRFALRLAGVRRPFAFWHNMMECYAQA